MERNRLSYAGAKGMQKTKHGGGTLRKTLGKPSAHPKHKVIGEEFEADDALKVPISSTKPKYSSTPYYIGLTPIVTT